MDVLQHTTIQGQRWDSVAIEYYGSLKITVNEEERSSIGYLIESNPGVPVYDVFPDGVILDIPIIQKSEVITDLEKMPPWKQ